MQARLEIGPIIRRVSAVPKNTELPRAFACSSQSLFIERHHGEVVRGLVHEGVALGFRVGGEARIAIEVVLGDVEVITSGGSRRSPSWKLDTSSTIASGTRRRPLGRLGGPGCRR